MTGSVVMKGKALYDSAAGFGEVTRVSLKGRHGVNWKRAQKRINLRIVPKKTRFGGLKCIKTAKKRLKR